MRRPLGQGDRPSHTTILPALGGSLAARRHYQPPRGHRQLPAGASTRHDHIISPDRRVGDRRRPTTELPNRAAKRLTLLFVCQAMDQECVATRVGLSEGEIRGRCRDSSCLCRSAATEVAELLQRFLPWAPRNGAVLGYRHLFILHLPPTEAFGGILPPNRKSHGKN
jgi:hypothetical protein